MGDRRPHMGTSHRDSLCLAQCSPARVQQVAAILGEPGRPPRAEPPLAGAGGPRELSFEIIDLSLASRKTHDGTSQFGESGLVFPILDRVHEKRVAPSGLQFGRVSDVYVRNALAEEYPSRRFQPRSLPLMRIQVRR